MTRRLAVRHGLILSVSWSVSWSILWTLCAASSALAQPQPQPQPQPQIDLAPEDATADDVAPPIQSTIVLPGQPAAKGAAAPALPRQSQIDVALDPRTARLRGAAVGGYGEAILNAPIDGSGPAIADLRRTILFFGFNFTDRIRFFSEIEMEHALTTSGARGEVAVEQVLIDFLLWRFLNLRAGMILMPVNLINIYHEPSTFLGVERPDVDLFIVPSTWKQLGAGLFGALGPVRYQLYVTPGMRAEGFGAQTGVRGGVQDNFVLARDWGLVGRLDWAPLLGSNLGLSVFWSRAGQGDPNLGDVPVTIAALDAKYTRFGASLRGQLSYIHVGDTELLNAALAQARPGAGPVARQLLGGYVELGYDLFHPIPRPRLRWAAGWQLWAFLRYERTDTQLDVAEGLWGGRQPGTDRTVYTAGLVFRPILEVAVKVDWQLRHTEVPGSTRQALNVGLAYQF